jgi:uncharacterized protein
LRKASPKWLLAAGVLLALTASGKYLWSNYDDLQLRNKAMVARQLAAQGKPLTEEQKEDQKKWDDKWNEYKPNATVLAKEIEPHRGSYWKLFKWRWQKVAGGQSKGMYRYGIYDVGGLMLIGMALLLLGVLTGQRSERFYVTLLLCGYGVGVTVNALSGWYYYRSGFNPVEGLMALDATYDLGRFSVALGHIGLLVLLVKKGWLRALTARLSAVGQMALSNYLATSVICTTIFYGYGFGQFAKLQRYQLLYVVFAVWVLLLIVSPIWLRHFRFGPMEWVWRSLTYWQRQPMRLKEKAVVVAPEPVVVSGN